MSERNLKPSIIQTLHDIQEEILKTGLKRRDLVLLLQDRIRVANMNGWSKKMPRKHIEAVLKGLEEFEKELLKNQKERESE